MKKLLLVRFRWFGLVFAFFFAKDACLGGGGGEHRPHPPQQKPAGNDAATSLLFQDRADGPHRA
jgi:hypothetical protein